MCVKRPGLIVHVAVAKASLEGFSKRPSAQHAINSRVLLYKVTHTIWEQEFYDIIIINYLIPKVYFFILGCVIKLKLF